MTDIGPSMPTSYISDGELIAWLEEKSEGEYSDLREVMKMSEDRGALMKELSELKADVDAGDPPEELLAKIESIRAEYKGTPFEAELDALLLPMVAAYVPCLPAEKQEDAGELAVGEIMSSSLPEDMKFDLTADLDLSDDAKAAREEDLKERTASSYEAEFSSKLESEIDQLGRIDQLELIKIQELISDARQTAQLGSNILSSRDQTSNAIVGNIRG
jgi:hypothetical protein